MKKVLIWIFLVITSITAQNKIELAHLHSKFAEMSYRRQYKKQLELKAQKLLSEKDIPLSEQISLLNEISLMNYKPIGFYDYLLSQLENFRNNPSELNNRLLESLKALYPDSARALVLRIAKTTDVFSTFVYAACVLMHYPAKEDSVLIDSLLQRKFVHTDTLLRKLFTEEFYSREEFPKDKLSSLLAAEFQKGKTVIFSLQRRNRIYPGITVIRRPDGKFVREEDGKIFWVPQLALAAANLPGYLKNGNTPQGIFSVVGFYITQKESIGPTPIVLTRIPFGKAPSIFFHGLNKHKNWAIEDYAELLPVELRDYKPLYESYFAGKLGRRLLVMHGSTDDLSFYKDKPYYPFTPTHGCLSTVEIWNEQGNVVRSDQARLINAFFSTKELKGFLVVVNIGNERKPVTIDEIRPYILSAEKH